MRGLNRWVVTFAATAAQMILGMATSVILARSLGPDNRGLLAAIVFWPTFLFQVAYFSLNEATAHEVARAGMTGKRSRDVARAALTLHIFSALWVCVFVAIVLPLVINAEHVKYIDLIFSYGIGFVILTVIDLFNHAALQGSGQTFRANLLRLIQPSTYAVLLLILLLLREMEVPLVLGAMLFSSALSVVVGFALSRVVRPACGVVRAGSILKTAVRFHGVNILLYVSTEIDKLVVIRWMGNAEIGYYMVALAYAMLGMGMVVSSFAVLTYADIASLQDRKDQAAQIARYSRYAMFLAASTNLLAGMLAVWLLPLIYGEAFIAAVPIATILLVATACKALRQVLDRALRACLNTRLAIGAEIVSMTSFIVLLALVLNVTSGLPAVATAIAASQVLALAFLMVKIKRSFNLALADMWGLRLQTLAGFARLTNNEIRSLARMKRT